MLYIYETENQTGTATKYDKNMAIKKCSKGTCGAQSVIFLKKFNVTKPQFSKPDPHESLILQAKAEILTDSLDDFTKELVETVGLSICFEREYFSLRSALIHMSLNKGQYLFGFYCHLVAVVNQTDGFYFFDPNAGLFYENDMLDFVETIEDYLSIYKNSSNRHKKVIIFSIIK